MFRLHKFTITRHKILGRLNLVFCNGGDNVFSFDNHDIFTSVIIGANGIGKSHLMRAIADIFCYLQDRKENNENPRVPQFYFDIEYYYGRDNLYRVTNLSEYEEAGGKKVVFTGFRCWLNGIPYNTNELDLPIKVIASTMTVSDKFLAKSDSHYIYKGIRSEQTPSMTGTRTMVRKTVRALTRSLEQKVGFTDEIKSLLVNLGLVPKLHLSYSFRYRNVFMKPGRDLTPELLCDIFEERTDDFAHRKTKAWGVAYYHKIKDDRLKLHRICDFINMLKDEFGDRRIQIEYDVLDESQRLTRDESVLDMLSSLDILSFPSLRVFKDNQEFDFEQSSSGETHLICQMIGIMSDIEDNCLVLVDEPENSSHPNWQMNYIDWLNDIFKKYHTSHFVVATHSHFLLTNLKPDCSNIIALENENGLLRDVAEGVNTFCWSVDDILYRVFHVRNVRNSVFESRMVRLYKLLEQKEQNLDEIHSLVEELSRYKLNAEDPLNKLLKIGRNA